MITLAHSVANGLVHLHGPISDERGDKPAIVHRNLSSSSIYVKADGKTSLVQFSLEIMADTFLSPKNYYLGETYYVSA